MKKCKQCKLPSDKWLIPPRNSLQAVCSPSCAREYAKVSKLRKEAQNARKTRKETKDKLKTRSDWIKEAQSAFNSYIRKRDEKMPCISCGRFHEGQWHAGHYRSIGANPELRFNEKNCHKQCQPCNTHLHGNLINYRINLIERIGQSVVDVIEGNHEPKKYTIDDLKNIKEKYKLKLKELP